MISHICRQFKSASKTIFVSAQLVENGKEDAGVVTTDASGGAIELRPVNVTTRDPVYVTLVGNK